MENKALKDFLSSKVLKLTLITPTATINGETVIFFLNNYRPKLN